MTFALAALAAAVGEQTDAWWAFGTLLIVLVAGGGAALVLGRKHVLAAPPPPRGTEPGAPIMRCMDPMQRLPALATLAKEFAVCTRWHCSVPGATWPNRNFADAATSDGTVDIEIGFYEDDTIFDRLEDHGRSWHVYHDGIAQLIAFRRLWDDDRIANWFCFDDFANHVASDALPHYSFIEPCHTGPRSNSQHPGNNDFDSSPTAPGSRFDFERGDDLIASIYETLRAHPDVFAKNGVPRHLRRARRALRPRRSATSPLAEAARQAGRDRRSPYGSCRCSGSSRARVRFRRYGPRVPAVVVSPRVVAATVDDTVYDHTSIPATVRVLFAPGAEPLSRREAHAATFQHLMTGPLRTDLPDLGSIRRTAAPPAVTSEPQAAAPAPVPVGAPQDDFARQLDELATHLDRRLDQRPAAPPGGPGAGSSPDTARAAVAPATTPGPDHTDRVAARFVHHAGGSPSRGSHEEQSMSSHDPVDPATSPPIAIGGRIVTMDDAGTVIDNGVVYVDGGRSSTSARPRPPRRTGSTEPVVRTGGTIYPGLIELHNHLSYNIIPLWQVPQTFVNRDQWAGRDDYRPPSPARCRCLGADPDRRGHRALRRGQVPPRRYHHVAGHHPQLERRHRKHYRGVVRNVEQSGDPDLPNAATHVADVAAGTAEAFLGQLESGLDVAAPPQRRHRADGRAATSRRCGSSPGSGPSPRRWPASTAPG